LVLGQALQNAFKGVIPDNFEFSWIPPKNPKFDQGEFLCGNIPYNGKNMRYFLNDLENNN
jgi:hypothetical protein